WRRREDGARPALRVQHPSRVRSEHAGTRGERGRVALQGEPSDARVRAEPELTSATSLFSTLQVAWGTSSPDAASRRGPSVLAVISQPSRPPQRRDASLNEVACHVSRIAALAK